MRRVIFSNPARRGFVTSTRAQRVDAGSTLGGPSLVQGCPVPSAGRTHAAPQRVLDIPPNPFSQENLARSRHAVAVDWCERYQFSTVVAQDPSKIRLFGPGGSSEAVLYHHAPRTVASTSGYTQGTGTAAAYGRRGLHTSASAPLSSSRWLVGDAGSAGVWVDGAGDTMPAAGGGDDTSSGSALYKLWWGEAPPSRVAAAAAGSDASPPVAFDEVGDAAVILSGSGGGSTDVMGDVAAGRAAGAAAWNLSHRDRADAAPMSTTGASGQRYANYTDEEEDVELRPIGGACGNAAEAEARSERHPFAYPTLPAAPAAWPRDGRRGLHTAPARRVGGTGGSETLGDGSGYGVGSAARSVAPASAAAASAAAPQSSSPLSQRDVTAAWSDEQRRSVSVADAEVAAAALRDEMDLPHPYRRGGGGSGGASAGASGSGAAGGHGATSGPAGTDVSAAAAAAVARAAREAFLHPHASASTLEEDVDEAGDFYRHRRGGGGGGRLRARQLHTSAAPAAAPAVDEAGSRVGSTGGGIESSPISAQTMLGRRETPSSTATGGGVTTGASGHHVDRSPDPDADIPSGEAMLQQEAAATAAAVAGDADAFAPLEGPPSEQSAAIRTLWTPITGAAASGYAADDEGAGGSGGSGGKDTGEVDFRLPELKEAAAASAGLRVPIPGKSHLAETPEGTDGRGQDYSSEHPEDPQGRVVSEPDLAAVRIAAALKGAPAAAASGARKAEEATQTSGGHQGGAESPAAAASGALPRAGSSEGGVVQPGLAAS